MAISAESQPLITIILLCHNHQNFAADAVGGVLAQAYRPLEVIIFDDCSNDRTAEAIENALAQRPYRPDTRFVRNSANMGPRTVSGLALEMAKGAFIFVSHGDDIMLPGMVDEVAWTWHNECVSLVTTNAYYIDENSNSLNRTFRDVNQSVDDSFETLARDGANACCFGPAIGFERAIYDKFGWVPDSLRGYDVIYPFYAHLLKGAKFINKPLLKYRVHNQNTSLSLAAERATSRERVRIQERIYLNHLAHATLMEEELDRQRLADPERYNAMAERIKPLLNIQLAEMAKKLVRISRESGTIASESRR
jgi:glycosyltransferase involved in cell wall biosynthesis